ncbi:uncharacterized protein LOC134272573 [Saccostrea cucullata]|uniref:uncharacterized protein LOC134272573 n=1 Tax=Saccostrea cuccullata TaxID=36930 RepID=UPI002ED6A8A5
MPIDLNLWKWLIDPLSIHSNSVTEMLTKFGSDEHTYDYIDSSAFSNYAYEGHSSIQKNREVFEPTPPKRSSVSISRQNRCLFVSVIVGVIIVIITVVVVIVVKKKNESKPQAPMEFEATMTLVTPWQPEYDDPDSEIYQRFTSALLAQKESFTLIEHKEGNYYHTFNTTIYFV